MKKIFIDLYGEKTNIFGEAGFEIYSPESTVFIGIKKGFLGHLLSVTSEPLFEWGIPCCGWEKPR